MPESSNPLNFLDPGLRRDDLVSRKIRILGRNYNSSYTILHGFSPQALLLPSSLTPVFLVMGGAFTWAVGQVMVKELGPVGGFTLIAWVAVFASPQLFVSSWLFENDQVASMRNAGPVVWAALAYLAFVMTALGYAMWYRLLGKYSVNQVMPFLLLLPLFTVIGGVLLLDEELSRHAITGGIMTVTGVAIINLLENPSPAVRPRT